MMLDARTVLVIEDNTATRKVVRLTLASEGVTVVEAPDAARALEWLATGTPDLILQDMLLPDMDGFDLVRRLRAMPELASVPIVAFSGFLSRLEYGRAAAAGFTDLLPKPVEPARLMAVVASHLSSDALTQVPFGAGRHLLVVDDDPVQRKLARLRLSALGFDVATAEDGVAALAALNLGGIDAVLSDVLMPRLDGFGLCAAIRRDPALARVPVILVSSNYVEDADREVGESMGASAFVARTPDLAEAIAALARALSTGARPPRSIHPEPGEHHARVVRQLEQQVAMNSVIAHRMSMHASMLSVVAGISETLTHRRSVEGSMPDVLSSLLEASGVWRGAIYLAPPDAARTPGALALSVVVGFSDVVKASLDHLSGCDAFARAIATQGTIVLTDACDEPGVRDLLGLDDGASALVVPFFSGDECLGILLLASKGRDLTGDDWIPFARTIAVQIGQSLALSRAFARLAESETRYRRIIETTNEGVWIADEDNKTSFVNARMTEILGRPASEILGRRPTDFFDADGKALFAKHAARLAEGLHERSEFEFHRPDGTSVWTLVESSPILDEAGALRGAFAMVTDITSIRDAEAARRRAEELLRASEAEYKVLFDSSPLPKFVYDVDTLRFLAVNDATVRSYGYERDELLATTIRAIRPPEEIARLESLHRTGVDEGLLGVWRHRRKDGTLFDAEIHAHSFEQNGARRRLIVAKDVTEQRRLEEQLRQAQKMEAVGRLAGGVAHDFNNILSVILSYSDLVHSDLPVGEPLRADVEEITKAANRAAELTRQLLMFSRQQVLEPKVLQVDELLTDVDRMLRRILGADVDLSLVLGSERGAVRADRGSLEQVVMNLVVNARDAMPTGGKLTIETSDVDLDEAYARAHTGSNPGPHVMIAVSDTGTGMDEATKARIFEPFFTTKAQGKGTGLGLATVFGIVHQSGGTVWVYSEVGKGTTFKVFLPRVDARGEADVSERPQPPSRGSETILLVDDDDQLRAVTRTMLRKSGYTVLDAANAAEASQSAGAHAGRIDLLLTDVVMPHTSGVELARSLAASRPEMKLLCMSGYTDDSVVRHGVIEGHVAFLQKPITPQSLARKVRSVLDGEGTAQKAFLPKST